MMLAFVAASIIVELTPGPNMTWLAVLGATRGRNNALSAVAGIALGLAIAAIVAGTGLTALLDRFPGLFDALRSGGTLYLLYLAWDTWRDAHRSQAAESTSMAAAFRQGLISNILNPRAYLFYAAMLPQFMEPGKNPLAQLALLSSVYVVIATVIHGAIALASSKLAPWLEHSSQAAAIRKAMALLIAGAAIWFFYSLGAVS
jgi:threonine/homoserine/homoserine lactone efflux protein